jgi:HAMP domain-containing protein
LAALLVPHLVAQGDPRSRLAGRVPPAVAADVSLLVDSARARGLPAGPLVDKALEGAMKGVAPDRIVPAVRGVLQQLDAAARALRAAGSLGLGDAAVEAGAFALDAGLTAGDVGDIARAADRSYPTAVALQVAGLLVALGVPRAETVGLVRATIRSGRPLGDLVSLPNQVQAAMASGSPPAAAAAGLERAAAAHQAPRPRGQGKGQGNPHKP